MLPLGLPFAAVAVNQSWQDWPSLPDLFPTSIPGVKTSRDSFLTDIDFDRLKARIGDYFNPNLGHDEIARRYPSMMNTTAQFNSLAVRRALLSQGGVNNDSFVKYAYRPFDIRWLYWESTSGLLDRPRPDYQWHVFQENRWLVFQRKARPDSSPPLVLSALGDLNQMNSGVYCVPAWLRGRQPRHRRR